LDVWAQCGFAVKWFSGLDLADHLLHVHLDLAGVLGGAVESDCSRERISLAFLVSAADLHLGGEAWRDNVRTDRW
jgi:hypothetical protein